MNRDLPANWRGFGGEGVSLHAYPAEVWDGKCFLSIGTDRDDGQIAVGIWDDSGHVRRSTAFWMPRETAAKLRDELTVELNKGGSEGMIEPCPECGAMGGHRPGCSRGR